jgi:membrane-associated PAP2 superfamily phosphatase
LAAAAALIVLTTLFFRFTDWDLRIAAWFFNPSDPANPWPYRNAFPWRLLYLYGPWPGIIVAVLAGLAVIGSYFLPRFQPVRIYGIFIVLTLVLGPGLLVNSIFKDHWGRPRPVQITQFGGKWTYAPVLSKGQSGKGKAFPCGHSSVGYYLGALYFIAWSCLAVALAYGTLLGIARLAAGSHFASDVLWSLYLPFLMALALYYFILRIPAAEDAGLRPASLSGVRRVAMIAGATVVVTGIVMVLLLASPIYRDFDFPLKPADAEGIARVEVRCAVGDLEMALAPAPATPVLIHGIAHGFGFPGNVLAWRALKPAPSEPDRLQCLLDKRGFFSELDVRLTVRLDPGRIRQIAVFSGDGDLTIRGALPPAGSLWIAAELPKGSVFAPAAWRNSPGTIDAGPARIVYRDDHP